MLQKSKQSDFSLNCLEISDFYISWTSLTHQSIGILDQKYMELIDQLQMNKAIHDCCLIPSQFFTKKKTKTLRDFSIASHKTKNSLAKKPQVISETTFSKTHRDSQNMLTAQKYYAQYKIQEQKKPRRSFILPQNSRILPDCQNQKNEEEKKLTAKHLRHNSDITNYQGASYYNKIHHNCQPKTFLSTQRYFNHNNTNNNNRHHYLLSSEEPIKVQYSQVTKSILQRIKNKNHQVFIPKKKHRLQKQIKLPYLNRIQSKKILSKIQNSHPVRTNNQVANSQKVSPRLSTEREITRVCSQPSLRIRKINSPLWKRQIISQKLKTAIKVLNQSQSNVTTSKLNQDV